MHPQNTMHCAELQTGLRSNRCFESPPVQVQHCYLAIAVPSQFLFPNKEMDIPNRCDNHAKITFLASHRAEERTVHIHEKAYSNRQVYLTSNNSDPELESVSKSSDKQRTRTRSRYQVSSNPIATQQITDDNTQIGTSGSEGEESVRTVIRPRQRRKRSAAGVVTVAIHVPRQVRGHHREE